MDSPDSIIGPVNLGNPQEFSILDLAHQVLELTNSKSEIGFEALPENDPSRRQPDITLARQILNWEPKVQLKEGLEKTVIYFDQILSSEVSKNSDQS